MCSSHDGIAGRVGARGGGVAVAGGFGSACRARRRTVVVGRTGVRVGHGGCGCWRRR